MTVPGKGGKPRKFTRELAQGIIDMVRHGSTFQYAAEAAGISRALESTWRKLGKGDDPDPDYAWYLDEVERARAECFNEAVECVVREYREGHIERRTSKKTVTTDDAGKKHTFTEENEYTVHHKPDFRAATWMLENSFKLKYNPKQAVEHSGQLGAYNVVVTPGPAPMKEGDEDGDE